MSTTSLSVSAEHPSTEEETNANVLVPSRLCSPAPQQACGVQVCQPQGDFSVCAKETSFLPVFFLPPVDRQR